MDAGARATARAIAIGASAGAMEALGHLLPQLPERFPWPVFAVVHLPPRRPSMLAELFRARCALQVCEVEDKQAVAPATIYFCPPDYHLLIESTSQLALSVDPPVLFSRPSIDVLFESVGEVYGGGAIGVILSGANADGARGLAGIAAQGGRTIVQAPSTAVARAMPEAALRAVPAAEVLAPEQIGRALARAAQALA